MLRYVHRSGVGVIAWRQASGVTAAATLSPRDSHRRIVSRGRVVRGSAGYGVVTGAGNASGSLDSVSLTAPTATASGGAAGNASGSLASTSLTPPSATASGAVTATVGRPASDTSNTGWTPSSGVSLYPMVDEVVPDALDYISTTTIGSICEMALNPTAYPGTASQQLKYRASSSTGNSVIVRIKEGATTIRSAMQALTATDTEYTIALTSGEIAAITSGNLSVELESA